MEVKVKASIIRVFDSYDYSENYYIRYTYKTKGFKKSPNNRIALVWKQHGESKSDYDRRIVKELSLLTKEEVVENVKKGIITNLRYRIASNTNENEKKRLLKELSNIKFNFTIKEKL